ISLAAFKTAVTYVMLHVRANRAWIGVAMTNVGTHQSIHTKNGPALYHAFSKTLQTARLFVSAPKWIVVTPKRMGTGTSVGFHSPVPFTLAGSNNCVSPMNLGFPTVVTIGGTHYAAATLYAGGNFI